MFNIITILLNNLYLYKKIEVKIYTLKRKQRLPISLDEAWSFLSNPKNLKVITPDYMGFKTLSGDDKPMDPGEID